MQVIAKAQQAEGAVGQAGASRGIGREGPSLFDGVDLHALAAQVSTPCHAYSANAIRERIAGLQSAFQGLDHRICYAVKANSNVAILQLMAHHGVGADIVSLGELNRALLAGIPAEHIVFSGVGKTTEEIASALAVGVWRFNVESLDELQLLQEVAQRHGVCARAAARINPDVDARTHEKISTGKSENKFGVSIDEARRWFANAGSMSNVLLDGLHAHIGSQILELEPFREALTRVEAFRRELVDAGHPIASVDIGGGLGVCYRKGVDHPIPAAEYAGLVRVVFAEFQGTLVLEPGRYLVAEAGILLTRVIRVKPGVDRSFLVVDAAMNDLLRPSLYEAWHEIVPLVGGDREPARYDVVGPVCETGDTFARGRAMARCEAGDLLSIGSTGAYGASMASTYNSRPLAAEVLLDDGRYAVIRRRQTMAEMIAGEQLPQVWNET
ncbi:diaminopimelate decarboxylase [Lysobacter arenosi]|uniref:Diaminopimelate decarboxylase n=1 Tax=Lysobacter arenosi TaxID=2795387 RepID=A0ABX7RB91_9GAMM|nr:diaminopimelate decarboxylase [Lysobacter arenosi]QSX75399.1 diaminopimelate decarboxylase [Lysobacter arenosi]